MSVAPIRSITRLAIAIVIAAVVLSASVLSYGYFESTVTKTISTGSVTTVTSTTTTTSTSVVTVTSEINCGASDSTSQNFSTLVTGVGSPAYVCIRLYYYNETAAITYNPLKQISIQGFRGGSSYDVTNFTVSAQPSTITIGGPNNESEGAVIVYTIIGNAGSNGTYNLGFGLLLPSMTACAQEFLFVSGTGVPNVSFVAGCIGVGNTSSLPYPPGIPVVGLLGAINGTSD